MATLRECQATRKWKSYQRTGSGVQGEDAQCPTQVKEACSLFLDFRTAEVSAVVAAICYIVLVISPTYKSSSITI